MFPFSMTRTKSEMVPTASVPQSITGRRAGGGIHHPPSNVH